MRFIGFILSVLSFSFLQSCDIVNPAEKVPTYVHVDSFQFVSTVNTGTASHKITNVAAYFENAPLGIFDLPADIPVLADKPGSLLLVPSVQFSGMSDRIVQYPFYRGDTATLTPAPGKRVTIAPVTSYWGDSTLKFTIEDFESGNSFVPLEGDTVRRTSDPQYVFEGQYGGVILLNDTSRAVNIMSVPFFMPATGANKAEVYLELNYKCSVPFLVGLQTTDGGSEVTRYLYGFNARDSWNKVYIGLEEFISVYQNKPYRVLIGVSKESLGSGYVAFDNFKVVSRR